MDLLEELRKLNPTIKEFVKQEIVDENKSTLGFRCYGVDETGTFSGGTAQDENTALRIAVAESFERSLFRSINQNESLKKEFLLEDYPSTSGFAAGFDKKSTRFRAICEGLERWIWSKWIDENYKIEETKVNSNLPPLSQHLLKDFDEALWLKKDFELQISKDEKLTLSIVIFLGMTENGIFPGSRVSTLKDELYEHPIIEAHRNLINFKIFEKENHELRDIIEKQAMFFGQNKAIALSQIDTSYKLNWPTPELLLLKEFDSKIPGVFLQRCLMKDFLGWDKGPTSRFVY